jgi:membrane associated rhomboid family serine protease
MAILAPSMRADRQRWELIAVLVAAAIVAPFAHWAAFVGFVVGAAMYLRWRRTAVAERRGRVFDREAKTDETRTRPDQ